MIDFYKVLGIKYTDNQKIIHDAFRKIALKYHPDRNKERGSEEKFKEINEAYKILSNKDTKFEYDMIYFKKPQPEKRNIVKKYSGEDEKIYSDDKNDKFNSYIYKNTKNEF